MIPGIQIADAVKDSLKVTYIDNFKGWLLDVGVPDKFAYFTEILILLSVVALFSVLGNFIARKIILSVINALVKKSKTDWDDILLDHKVFDRLSHFAPALIIYFSADYIFIEFPKWLHFIQKCSYLYMIGIALVVVNSFINGIHDIYKTLPVAKNRSIKGYIQVLKIIVYIVGGIVILATLMGKSPVFMLSGLGAFTAVLLLIFQDTIKGLVGGIQLSANDLIRLGDWITVPKHNVDGTVIEIAISTVKIQNADMTISAIPTYSLVTDSFQNWRSMTESGGRRIKRSVHIDLNTVRFCDDALMNKFQKIQLISDYIKAQKTEIDAYNTFKKVDSSLPLNGKQLTNLTVFRKYLEAYLKNHENVNPEMTWIVRYLEPVASGLPLEIWVFSKHKDLEHFEMVQSEIFDHVFTAIPEFGLKIFQAPSGEDMRKSK
jgi:miniconductance mechanosensitive channel